MRREGEGKIRGTEFGNEEEGEARLEGKHIMSEERQASGLPRVIWSTPVLRSRVFPCRAPRTPDRFPRIGDPTTICDFLERRKCIISDLEVRRKASELKTSLIVSKDSRTETLSLKDNARRIIRDVETGIVMLIVDMIKNGVHLLLSDLTINFFRYRDPH